jgi:hypothetical protein
VDKVSGSTFMSTGLLAGQVHLIETSGTLVGGDHGYPCLSSPRSMCRRSSRDEVMSRLGEVMASSRSCRVHGDPKRNGFLQRA